MENDAGSSQQSTSGWLGRHRERRVAVLQGAARRARCNVIDISDCGAKLRTHNLSVLPNTFELTFDNFWTIRMSCVSQRDHHR